jgi:hypothetical protein
MGRNAEHSGLEGWIRVLAVGTGTSPALPEPPSTLPMSKASLKFTEQLNAFAGVKRGFIL